MPAARNRLMQKPMGSSSPRVIKPREYWFSTSSTLFCALAMMSSFSSGTTTSSIDTETERLIQDALETLRRGRTTIVVAHRLSTIRKADQILVLHHGRVRERGDHASLLRAGGLYRRLYELQVRQAGME